MANEADQVTSIGPGASVKGAKLEALEIEGFKLARVLVQTAASICFPNYQAVKHVKCSAAEYRISSTSVAVVV